MKGLDSYLTVEPDAHQWCAGPCETCGACLSCEQCAPRCEYREGEIEERSRVA